MAAPNLYECHGHILLDETGLGAARTRHSSKIDATALRTSFKALQNSGVSYFRDGGDNLGVCAYAREIAPAYGIRYAAPAFAIYKNGHYGSKLGRPYHTISDFRTLVIKSKEEGADFIKLMLSGIMTFADCGELSCPSLSADEIGTLIQISHQEGFRVMAHVNGSETIQAALKAGVDSVEHGYFMNDACLDLLVQTEAVWVPTLAPVAVFAKQSAVAGEIFVKQMAALRRAFAKGVLVASGSDSGAHGVPHGEGVRTELKLLKEASGLPEHPFEAQLQKANKKICATFVFQ
ncbi:MAG: amidohydrolase family protein [Oscillospiraceae bacterium]|nr:amidohydrolase family protein [Oscillospiraceae bacterium]